MIQRPASAQPKTRKGKAGKRKLRYWMFETKSFCILCCSKWILYDEVDLSFQVSYESIFFVWRKTKQRENFQLYSGRREQIFRNWFHSSWGALQKTICRISPRYEQGQKRSINSVFGPKNTHFLKNTHFFNKKWRNVRGVHVPLAEKSAKQFSSTHPCEYVSQFVIRWCHFSY